MGLRTSAPHRDQRGPEGFRPQLLQPRRRTEGRPGRFELGDSRERPLRVRLAPCPPSRRRLPGADRDRPSVSGLGGGAIGPRVPIPNFADHGPPVTEVPMTVLGPMVRVRFLGMIELGFEVVGVRVHLGDQ